MKKIVLFHGATVLFNSFSLENYYPGHYENKWGIYFSDVEEYAFDSTNKTPVHYDYYWVIDGKKLNYLYFDPSFFTAHFFQKLNLCYTFKKHEKKNFKKDILKLLIAEKERIDKEECRFFPTRKHAFLECTIHRIKDCNEINLKRKSSTFLHQVCIRHPAIFNNGRQLSILDRIDMNRYLVKNGYSFYIPPKIDFVSRYETVYQYLIRKFSKYHTFKGRAAFRASHLLATIGYDLIKTNLQPCEYLYISHAEVEILSVFKNRFQKV